MVFRLHIKIAICVALAVVGGGRIYANILPLSGNTGVPTQVLHPVGTPILLDPYSGADGDFSSPATWKTARIIGGSIDSVSAVFLDPVTGGLDFYYQLQNISTTAVAAKDTINPIFVLYGFAGFATDIYQISKATGAPTNLFGNSSVSFKEPTADTIQSVKRSGAVDEGDALTVTLSGAGLIPQKNSAILLIKTNATSFDAGGSAAFRWNGAPPAGAVGTANTIAFSLGALEPVAIATPEPALFGLMSAGLLGLIFLGRRAPTMGRQATTASA